MTLYNEIEPFAAAWLHKLSSAGHIAPGSIDVRSIRDLRADDVVGATQFHAFAGIGVWSYALRLAGWPDGEPVWTGSCPCQPFSVAGRGKGTDDERHLWPEWFRLIRECHPPVVFGEQVASPDGLAWLDAVYADLEGEGYAVGAADLCAAGVGAPHIRQRLYFGAVRVADAYEGQRRWLADGQGRERDRTAPGREQGHGELEPSRVDGVVADPRREGRGQVRPLAGGSGGRGGEEGVGERPLHGGARDVAFPDTGRRGPCGLPGDVRPMGERGAGSILSPAASDTGAPRGMANPVTPGLVDGLWSDAEWLPCRDGKARPVEPGTFPLAHGAPARVGRLRAYGNAIVPQVAAAFVRAFMGSATRLQEGVHAP